ncbi:F-box domain-containing protein [Artemisia annua]|uniref:F-box domain-containing protein n=1 Tax=Artemisia annua TaxID=35608 RepID=A0A2U1M6K0_ARTAN|nr:F-box domain-containing protein [Artemisia annua]
MTLGKNRGLRLGKRTSLNETDMDIGSMDSDSPTKKQTMGNCFDAKRSFLEALPEDVLVRVLCGVQHADLKRLLLVSKTIREATIIAKKNHFEYSTPKEIPAFRCSVDLSSFEFEEVKSPNAPRKSKAAPSRLNWKELANLSVVLFA